MKITVITRTRHYMLHCKLSTQNKVHMLQKLARGPQGNKGCETADQSTVSSTARLLARGHSVHWIPAAEPKV